MIALALLLSLSAAPPFPEPLTRPLLARVEPFQWPSPKRFDAAWTKTAEDTRGHALLFLQVGGSGHGHWYVQTPVTTKRGGVQLDCIVGERDSLWAETALGDSFEAKRWETPVQVKVLERLEGTVSTEALVAWTYATTLLESNGPLYAEPLSSDETLRDLVFSLTKEPGGAEAWARCAVSG